MSELVYMYVDLKKWIFKKKNLEICRLQMDYTHVILVFKFES